MIKKCLNANYSLITQQLNYAILLNFVMTETFPELHKDKIVRGNLHRSIDKATA